MDRTFASAVSATPPSAPASPAIGYPRPGDPGGSSATKPGAWWYYMITESLRNIIVDAGLTPDHTDLTLVSQAVQSLAGIKRYLTGQTLPTANIGPIWHDDYNSIMTWQAFTANGAAYTGYSSLLVGGLLMDTQPTARQGYVKSGVSNLSRTTYAALRNWGLHHGVLVASGVWAAGAFAFKDNVDGTTFTVADVRGEFPRFWDDGRGVDTGRTLGSWQSDELKYHAHNIAAVTSGTGGTFVIREGNSGSSNFDTASYGGSETRPRNTALLASIKF